MFFSKRSALVLESASCLFELILSVKKILFVEPVFD